MRPSLLWRLGGAGWTLAAASKAGHKAPVGQAGATLQACSIPCVGTACRALWAGIAEHEDLGAVFGGATGGGGGGGHSRMQGEPSHSGVHYAGSRSAYQGPHDLGWLYSVHTTELQQQHFLRAGTLAAAAAAQVAADDSLDPPLQQVAQAGSEESRQAAAAPSIEPLEERVLTESEQEEAQAAHCGLCGTLDVEDFYEAEFAAERQLVLRCTWLCAGTGSLAAMRERLEERVRFLSDLEADGWQLEAPVDDEYACLRNEHPKPSQERRLADAWEIAELWEHGVEWERWPGPGKEPF